MRIATAVACLLMGCATVSSPRPTSDAIEAPLRIDLHPVEGEDAWVLHFRLPEKTKEIAFRRAGYPYRSQWSVTAPAHVQLRRGEGFDALVSTTGEPFSEVTLKVATYFRNPEKDYQVFIPYTDGGLLFYTGQFELVVPDGTSTRWTLSPRAGEHLVVMGAVHEGRAEWTSVGDGTYVYFGSKTPVETAHVVAVVDPGLPEWLQRRTETLIPQLFAVYAERLKVSLGFKPVVFVSYRESMDPGGRAFGGGVLPGVVQLEFGLPPELGPDADPSVTYNAAHLLAHESAHLWNAQLFRHEVKGGSWLHEGGADALALRALRDLGVIDDARYWEEQSKLVSYCLFGLEGAPLLGASGPGKSKNHYYCGATFNLLAEAALRAGGEGGDLFDFWTRVFAVKGDRTYDDGAFFEVLERCSEGRGVAAFTRQVIEGPVADLDVHLRSELERLGVVFELDESASDPRYQLLAGARAAFAVFAWDCGASGRAEPEGTSLRIAPEATCRTLRPGQQVDRIGPHRLYDDGAAAWDFLHASCTTSGAVMIGTEGGLVRVPCGSPAVARRPARFRLRGFASSASTVRW